MEAYIHSARKTMQHFINPENIDKAIPPNILKNAKGIAFITEIKAGFIWSGMIGRGIVLARKKGTNTWSGPSVIGTGGVGWGAQIGGSKTKAIIVLNSWSAVRAFAGLAQVKLGGDLSVAAGPVGRSAAANLRVGSGVAACYSYSHSKGLFAGIALEGAVLITLDNDNQSFYGSKVTANDILYGDLQVPVNADLQYIYDTLNKFQFDGEWTDDVVTTTPTAIPTTATTTYGSNTTTGPASSPTPSYSSAYQSGTIPYPESTMYQQAQMPTPPLSQEAQIPTPPPQGIPPILPAHGISQLPKAQANFDFDSSAPGDLSFKSGDVLTILNREGEWWHAEKNGVYGSIPRNYVSLL